jgi:predicted nucleic acid-binding protein
MANTIIDSSVWIDFFNKKKSPQIDELKATLLSASSKSPFIILPVVMQEVLQGIEDNRLYSIVKENLFGLEFIEFDNYAIAIEAADLFRFLRKKGVTIRKANDCLIAAICIANNFSLLHNDKDFNNIAKHTSLKIYK